MVMRVGLPILVFLLVVLCFSLGVVEFLLADDGDLVAGDLTLDLDDDWVVGFGVAFFVVFILADFFFLAAAVVDLRVSSSTTSSFLDPTFALVTVAFALMALPLPFFLTEAVLVILVQRENNYDQE